VDDYEISYSRAKSVNDYLIRRGISEKRIGYEGYSNSIPLIKPELTEEDQQRNRRVDVIFTIK
jgi:outer membrane protein OmpA-like peptidoglycan-associated protein